MAVEGVRQSRNPSCSEGSDFMEGNQMFRGVVFRTILVGLFLLMVMNKETAKSAEGELPDPALVEGNSTFALDIYQKLRDTKGNLFFSPYSISTALAMTHAGARESTADQIAYTLHFTLPRRELHPAFGALEAKLNAIQSQGDVQIHVANSLWPQTGYPFLEDYLQLIEKHYGSSITPVDYISATEEARQTINRWVEKKTQEKIKDLIQRGMLDASTVMVLTNAIYFKGNWARQFEEETTTEAPFRVATNRTVEVPMMRQAASFKYTQMDGIQILELPYEGNSLSMLVLLPAKVDGLQELERALTVEKLRAWTADLRAIHIRVVLPRFKVTSRFSLGKTLIDMGMFDAFDVERADFSDMDGKKNSLFISEVAHKAFVEVNEEGTEAAAATGVIMQTTSIAPEFVADRPFLFLIRESATGSILFMGRIVDPTAGGA
jgi:serpin B